MITIPLIVEIDEEYCKKQYNQSVNDIIKGIKERYAEFTMSNISGGYSYEKKKCPISKVKLSKF